MVLVVWWGWVQALPTAGRLCCEACCRQAVRPTPPRPTPCRSPAEGAYSEGLIKAKLTQNYGIECPATGTVFSLKDGSIQEWYPTNPVLRVLTPANTCRPLRIFPVQLKDVRHAKGWYGQFMCLLPPRSAWSNSGPGVSGWGPSYHMLLPIHSTTSPPSLDICTHARRMPSTWT